MSLFVLATELLEPLHSLRCSTSIAMLLLFHYFWSFDFICLSAHDVLSTNTKGLLTRQRQPKASAHALRERYQALAMDAHPRFTGDQLLDALIRFKPHAGDQSPISYHRLPALIREERVNTTIRKRSVDEIMTFFEHN